MFSTSHSTIVEVEVEIVVVAALVTEVA